MNPTLFQRLLGAEFCHLAPEVKALHSRPGRGRWRGKCTIKRGGNGLAQLHSAIKPVACRGRRPATITWKRPSAARRWLMRLPNRP